MTIVQLVASYGPRTGGIRTQVDALRRCYRAAGVETVLVVPGAADGSDADESGRIVRVRAPEFPLNRAYRTPVRLAAIEAVVAAQAPTAVEIIDKWTLPLLARRLRARGLPVLGFSCERLDQVLPPALAGRGLIRRYNQWFGRQFDALVSHSRFNADELRAVGARPELVPLGVDLTVFRPAARDEALRREWLGGGERLLVYAGRLVPEKRVELLAGLMQRLAPRGVRLVIAGSGPLADSLAAAPGTRLLGHTRDTARLAALYASADVCVLPSPVESFGLSALEAAACGTPVVASTLGATGELLPRAWPRCRPEASCLAAAVLRALDLPREPHARLARATAERYTWEATATRLLELHARAARELRR